MTKPNQLMRSVKLVKIGAEPSNKSKWTKKFWKARIMGRMMIATWGKIGTKGQTKKYILSSMFEARDKLRTTVAAKMGNKYHMIYGF